MATTGKDILADLREQTKQAGRDLRTRTERLNTLEGELHQREQELREGIKSLATLRLRGINTEEIRNILGPTLKVIDGLMEERALRLQAIDADMPRLEAILAETGAKLATLTARRDALAAQCSDAAARAEENADVIAARREEAGHARHVQACIERSERLRDLASQKLDEYRENAVFDYLLKRAYGKREYASGGVVARMDEFAARAIGYRENLARYEQFRDVPQAAERDVAAAKARWEEYKAGPLAATVQAALAQEGFPPLATEHQAICAEIAEITTRREEAQGQLLSCQEEKSAIAEDTDERFQKADAFLQDFVTNMSDAELRRQAGLTPDTADDRIVESIVRLRAQISTLLGQAQGARPEIDSLTEKLARMQKLETVVRRRYDSTYSEFRSFDWSAMLQGYLLGTLTSNDLSDRMAQAHVDTTPHFSSSSDSSGGGGFFGGGGGGGSDFGGGGFSSGGGDIGGGGFSSGGDSF